MGTVQLLEKDNPVDVAGDDGRNALMLAAMSGHVVARLLLAHEPNIEDIDQDTSTARMLASRHGHDDGARLLPGPDANAESTRSMEPAEDGFMNLEGYLANLNAENMNQMVTLLLEAQNGRVNAARLLQNWIANMDPIVTRR